MGDNNKTFLISLIALFVFLLLLGEQCSSEVIDKETLRSTYSRAYFEGAETGVKLAKDTNSTIVDFRESFNRDSLAFEQVIK